MSDPEPSALDQVLGGRCIHGHPDQKDCLTCGLTRYMATFVRLALQERLR